MDQPARPPVLLEGLHAVKHALRFAPGLVHDVVVRDRDRVSELAQRLAPDVAALLLALAVDGDVEHHTGVQALAHRPPEDRSVLVRRSGTLVVLDGPRDPGNLGAVVRVAAAAGAAGVTVVGDLDPWSAAALRGSAGLHLALPVLSCAPDEVVGPLVVLDAGGDPSAAVPAGAALVVGSERWGVGAALRERADLVLALPMRDGVSSLNLATAVAAVLYARRG